MNVPNHLERTEIRDIADQIIATLKSTKWDTASWQAQTLQSPRLTSARVTLASISGDYRDLRQVRGSSGITVRLPVNGFVLPRVKNHELEALKRVIYGVLVHECTHVIQRQAVGAAFKAAELLERELHTASSPTKADHFDLYIGQPLEQEARAAQAAAEIECLIGPHASQSDFDKQLFNTEVARRTCSQVGGPNSPELRVRSWWKIWAALAYDADR